LAGLEYMAQCISAHTGLVARARGEAPLLGFLLGSRCVSFHRPRYHPGESLDVTAQLVWGEMPGTMVFDCSIADRDSAAILADARLKCWVPQAGAALEEFG
jgi:predicted hotdog family 3-hydroxylacyl-ACP dehydratase